MDGNNLKDMVTSTVRSSVTAAFEESGWQQDYLTASVQQVTPSESVIAVRARNMIAGETQIESRYFRVKITEVK